MAIDTPEILKERLPAALPQVRARAKAASEEDGDYADGGSVEDRVRAKLDELSQSTVTGAP